MNPKASIAHFRMISKLGEGGMGEVWRATDTKLGREVAIKILPESLAADPDRLARFQREAQVLASLNHPNIASIYGVEEHALIMELVEGATLAERLATAPIVVDEAVPIARQIAEALEYAHERGIVHRDLKPANIKITPDGRVKVLDFGLAKALATEAPAVDAMSSPTLTMRATQMGTIIGTAAYMSPEQAKGKAVDRRADIWAFGVVVVEMLTGKRMYTGETVSETLASVIKDTPDLAELTEAPPRLVQMVRRCLEKDPRRRLQAIGEARIVLEGPLEPEPAPPSPSAPAAVWRRRAPWTAAGIFAMGVLVLGQFLWRANQPVLYPALRFNAAVGPDAVAAAYFTVAISPDGTRIVFPVRAANGDRLATRLMDDATATPLVGTDGAEQPFFSPDGQWIGFFADGKVKKVSVTGGAAVTLCDASAARGATWGEDGNIIANIDLIHLFRIPSGGGTPQVVGTPDDAARVSYRYPQILPSGQDVLVTVGVAGAFNDGAIGVLSLKSGKLKIVQRGGFFGRYLASGHLVFLQESTLFAVPFDLARLQTRGAAAPILEDVASNPGPATGQIDFARGPLGHGTVVYLAGKGGPAQQVFWITAAGKMTPLWATPAMVTPRLSHDGKRLAVSIARDISVYDSERGAATRITFNASGNTTPVWSLDGKHLVYASAKDGLWWTRADGSTQPVHILELPTATAGLNVPGSFSPDGNRLAYSRMTPNSNSDIWVLPLDLADPDHPKAGQPAPFVQSSKADMDPAFSPDGRWLAYTSTESGSLQVYVQPYPAGASAGKWQISSTAGVFPRWSPKGKELFYETPDGHIMIVDYTTKGETFTAGPPRRWSPLALVTTGRFANYDVAPDGQRLVAFPVLEKTGDDTTVLHATFLLNFFDELKRRLP
jgi:predicted Ser/Thr protein kinase